MIEQESLTDRDKRLFDRFHARFPVKFRYSREEYGSDVFLRDASAQGARFTTTKRMFLHDSVSLMVDLPDGRSPLILNGRVVWLKSKAPNLWDIGMEFHRVNFMQTQRIFKLVSNQDEA